MEEVWRTFLFLEMEWARVQHYSTPRFMVEMAIRKPFLTKRQLTVCWEFPKRHLKDFQTTKNKSSGLIKQRLNHLATFPISTCGGSQKLSSITLSLQSNSESSLTVFLYYKYSYLFSPHKIKVKMEKQRVISNENSQAEGKIYISPKQSEKHRSSFVCRKHLVHLCSKTHWAAWQSLDNSPKKESRNLQNVVPNL